MLSAKQEKCIKFMATGIFTQKEIAEQVNISEKTICQWKKDIEFMSEYDSAIRRNIQSFAAKAFNTQTKLLDAKSEMVRHMAAKDILDRAGFKEDKSHTSEGDNSIEIILRRRNED